MNFASPHRLYYSVACALLALLGLPALQGQHSHDGHALRPNVDRRQTPTLPAAASPSASAAIAQRDAAEALRGKVKNVRIDFDRLLGTPAFVGSTVATLTGPDGAGGAISNEALSRFSPADSHRVVKAFVDEHRELFGHGAEAVAAARVTRDYVTGHNGLRTIKWDQHLDDIRVFEATFQAHLTSRGELVNVASRFLPNLERAAERGAPGRAARMATPLISAAAAVAAAATDIGEELAADDVEAEAPATGAEKKQRFRAPVLLDAEAQYVWLPLDADTLRLCWEVICTSKEESHMYRVLVDAESGEVHMRHSLTEQISNASYRVFTSDSPSPFSPGHAAPSSVQPPTVPRTLVTLSALSLTASPNGWIDDGVMETRGNNVDAHTDLDANNVADLPRPQAAGLDRVFDPPLDLSQAPSTYRDAAVVNLFYWCNWMHDKLYDLGFTEAAGNFQVNNFGRGGLGNDPVQADAQDGSGTNNANFSTPPDGSSGRMQMFLWTGPDPDRDGDFDQEVVLHEYTHGLTNRLVGGGVGISALQSRGMGEGWSDFYGITLLAEAGDDIHGSWPRGGYSRYLASGSFTENYYFGGRRYPYSTNLTRNPLTFKDIDPAQASAHAGVPRNPIVGNQADQVHNMGEVWCVTLWEMRANLITKYGFATGNQLTLQLVTDGLKLAPANPNFVQARDAILQADLVNNGGANRVEMWAAFAKRGLGANASSPASSTTAGVVESYALPDDLAVAPTDVVAVAGSVGGPFAAQTYTLSNTGTSPLNWTVSNTQPWATLSPSSGSLAGGATANVTVSFTAAAAALPMGVYSDTLTFTNATSGVSQTRTLSLIVQAPPTIAGFSPTALAPGLSVTITGTAFVAPVTVRFNGVVATNVVVNSTTQITAVAPTTLTAGPITVTTAAGTATSATNFTVTGLPIISGFTPASGPNKRMVTLTGANFSGGAVTSRTVRVNGVSISSLTVSANQLIFPVPVGATTGPITVTTSGASGTIGTATSATSFVVAAGPAPGNDNFANADVISGSSGTIDVDNTDATLEPGEPKHGGNIGGASVWYSWQAPANGTYFFQVQDVGLNMGAVQGVYVGNAVDALALVASGSSNSPFSRFANSVMFTATGGTTYKIAVDGYDGLMGECRLAWSTLSAPTISSITASAYAGQSLAITGANFVAGASVTIGGVPVPNSALSYNSATSITVTQVPANVVSGPVAVTTAAGTAVSATNFTLLTAPSPTISSISPTSGGQGASVTISGTALSLAESGFPIVRFNGVPVTTINTQSATSLSVRVPIGATSGTISVQTSKGTATSATSFTVTTSSTPVIFGFAPASGPVGSGVTLTGANFSAVTGVTLNGASVPFSIASPGSIVVTLPPGATSGVFRVSTATVGVTSATSFIVTTPPTISGFSPTAIALGVPVVISGANFSAVSSVSFNGTPAVFTVDSSSQITATALSGSLTPGQIIVTTQGGVATSAGSFTVAPSGPVIASFTPTAIASGVAVTISGSGFTGVSAVRFNGVTGNFTVNSPTQIIATAPTTLTAGPITVTAGNLTATSPTNYTVTTAPIITSFTPTTATNKQEITLFGGNFLGTDIGTPSVQVNGIAITSSSRNNNRIVFPIPVGATTGPITITTLQGTTTSATNITIAPGPAPANDHFANAQLISGTSGSFTGNTANATKEAGEPNHSGNAGGASVWFKWTAPSSGWFLFNPFDSTIPHYGIIQAIYTGSSVNALTQVASGLPGTTVFTRYTSAAALNAVAGQTYYVALDGFGGVMADYRLSWSPLSPPTIVSFTPTSAAAGQTINVTVTGSGFTPGAGVTIGGAAVAANRITYNSSTSIVVAQIPSASVTGPIVITTPVGSVTSASNFTITSPYIVAFNPSSGAVGAAVTITGANFAGTTAVRFNGVPAASFVVDGSGQTITAIVPPGASTGAITVVTPLATVTSLGNFTVITPPEITQHPASQAVSVGDSVTFAVAATSNGPVTYRWTKNGVLITGNPSAETATLVIPSATLGDAGTYVCQVSNAAATVVSNAATLTVNKVPATVSLGGLVAVYDGTPKAVTATTVPVGLVVDLTYDGATAAPINAGTYAVVATINDPRYTGTASGTLTINRALASIALAGLSAIYDGSPKAVTATTTPAGLPVQITYGGSPTAPTNAGSYAVAATIVHPNYQGSASGTLMIAPAPVVITLSHLIQSYDGTPKSVGVATQPSGLTVAVTYNGSPTPPTYPGPYAVTATVVDPNRQGSTSNVLAIVTTALVRHASISAGGIDGSLQVVSAEDITIAGNGWIAHDLLVPGTPLLQLRGDARYVGTRDGGGNAAPATHTVTLNGTAALRYLVQRVNALPLPPVDAPPAPTGTRDVILSSPGDSLGDVTTIRDLTVRGNSGAFSLPPGTYGALTTQGNGGFVLGVAGATAPAIYNVQSLSLGGNLPLEVVGPVILKVHNGFSLGNRAGAESHPEWFTVAIHLGGLTLDGNATMHGTVVAPNGTVLIRGDATLNGRITADSLTVQGNGLLNKAP